MKRQREGQKDIAMANKKLFMFYFQSDFPIGRSQKFIFSGKQVRNLHRRVAIESIVEGERKKKTKRKPRNKETLYKFRLKFGL